MMSLRKFAFAAAVALGVAAADTPARAAGPTGCNGPFCNTPRYPALRSYLLHGHTHQPQPTFQAAPWYLYWPYDGHFLTPAPVHAPFYAPPAPGNFPVNPYFPAPAGSYGPIPGGPAPAGVPLAPGGFGPAPISQPIPPVMAPQAPVAPPHSPVVAPQ